ncbi:hypothetical protein BKA82DRAFT_152566 [Pisolithus tinctorius]|uniref:Uncharacterized protein n=1 Tax=Pisolithus tinctorius Marx 270 TaxID=870435 RepID=A0A0C3NZG7_PISTI|nr:hypothetical protein BKA82DRAFT_152566 [Pisolithus tinctorius]KIO00514.1 hypothetical protein M404DRAFT_152566 [Pisolithus tinctorius Marx 270]
MEAPHANSEVTKQQWAPTATMPATLLLWEDVQSTSPFWKRATHAVHFMINIPEQQHTEPLVAILLFLAGLAQSRDRGQVAGIGYILSACHATSTLLCKVSTSTIEATLASMFLGPEHPMQRLQRNFIATMLPEENDTQLMTTNIDHCLEVSK